MKPTVHILPQQGMGGAELAAQSAMAKHPNLSIFYLNGTGAGWLRLKTYRKLLGHLDANKAHTAVFSLWKTAPAMIIVRLFRPRVKRAMFLHNDRAIHWADGIFSQLMSWTTDFTFADSNSAAKRFRLEQPRVISFVMNRLTAKARPISPRFIFWGRLTEQKNLIDALRTFQLVRKSHPKAYFTIIGPDGGQQKEIADYIAVNNLTDHVKLVGQVSHTEITALAKSHSFYLQPSLYEGMAMSVVEAMQLGLIVVATPVGEIANYLTDDRNGISFENPHQAADRIVELLADKDRAASIAKAAQKHWQDSLLYADDFAAAVAEVEG